jgi:hypothetical protein
MMRGNINPYVNVKIIVHDIKTGKVLDVIKRHNLAVMTGRNLLRDFLNGDSVDGLSYSAVGTDNTAAASGDTTLGTEVFRKLFTQTNKTSGSLNIKTYVGSTEGNGSTLVEAGLFGGAATGATDSGTLYARATFTGIAKTSAIGVTFDWDCGFTVQEG